MKNKTVYPKTGEIKTFAQLVTFLKDNEEQMTDHSRTCVNHTTARNKKGVCCKQQKKYKKVAKR